MGLRNKNTWLTAKAGTFLQLWDLWLVEEKERGEEPGDNNQKYQID
jgi:hypothetical protein